MVAQISSSFSASSTRPAAARATLSHGEALLDAELVRRFNGGDDAAFVEIVTRYRGKMFGVALSTLGNHADAEEIVQETFIRAYRSLARFRGDSSLASWLHSIALNLARNRYRYYCRRHRHETRSFDCALSDDSSATFADLVTSDIPDPARAAANSEFSAHVTVCMGKLSAHQREILTLRNFLDHSYKEISATLGVSLGTVKSRIARARNNLRELLGETYAGVEPGASPFSQWFEPSRPSGRLNGACS